MVRPMKLDNSQPTTVVSEHVKGDSAGRNRAEDGNGMSLWRMNLLASIAPVEGLKRAAKRFQDASQEQRSCASQALNCWFSSLNDDSEPALLLRDVYEASPARGNSLTQALTSFPEVGCEFLGFRLITLLGKGAFGQVYLAEQKDLAGRPVALKVAVDIFTESQSLAQLQHTNIVPVYSIHRSHPFQAVCMPYLGATTLADIFDHLQGGESLPNSGKLLVSTVNDRKRSTRRLLNSKLSVYSESQPAPEQSLEATLRPALIKGAEVASTLRQLEGMSYAEAVLWLGARLADGLAHAHERGICHRDLKPANVLLTDDGQPMLLDFNLSEDTKLRGSARGASIGGTLPYMAPEHLQAFGRRENNLDGRSDVYSLGVILYELLTGRQPFPVYRGVSDGVLEKMIEDRRKSIPHARRFNSAVSPATESIIRHCLEADPGRRYRHAGELREDLERQLRHEKLRYAKDPSPRERIQKWCHRHPRLSSTTTIGAIAGIIVMAMATAFAVRGRQLVGLQAQESLRQFHEEMKIAQFLLYGKNADRSHLEEGITACRAALGRWQVLDNPGWRDLSDVRHLSREQQSQLNEETGELLFLLSKATSLYGRYYADHGQRGEVLAEAERYNGLAGDCFGEDGSPRALWDQRADLATLLGQDNLAESYRRRAAQVHVSSARDYYLIAHTLALEGRPRQALDLLQKATQQDPQSFSAWFVRGNCYRDLLEDGNAVACYNVCVALKPNWYSCWFNRGLAHQRLRNFRQAREDFGQVVRLRPESPEGYINKALAEHCLQDYQAAIDDYTQALAKPDAAGRVYFLRADARAQAGDKRGAEEDFKKGLNQPPEDEESWIARALARRDRDPKGALADLNEALKINPRSFEGMQNKAAILSDKFNNDAEALKVLEAEVKVYPESVLALGGRGVLLARANNRARALDDARACLLLDTAPPTLYQVACIYSLLSKRNPEDRLEAMHLLSSALRNGFGLEMVGTDTDLDPLRSDPQFQKMIVAARALSSCSSR
jgi:serine/threonine protein kinase/Tfp pilus assembly protein PilF